MWRLKNVYIRVRLERLQGEPKRWDRYRRGRPPAARRTEIRAMSGPSNNDPKPPGITLCKLEMSGPAVTENQRNGLTTNIERRATVPSESELAVLNRGDLHDDTLQIDLLSAHIELSNNSLER